MFKYLQKRQYDPISNQVLYPLIKADELLLQRMELASVNDVHQGCVNTVVWDNKGDLLLSGSDDRHLIISDPWTGAVKTKIYTAHRSNIFSAKFLPQSDNKRIISCSGGGTIIYTDVHRQEETYDNKFTCHSNTCYDIVTYPDDANTFLSCGEDKTVRFFDLRHKTKCFASNCNEDILLYMGCYRAVTAIAINPVITYHLAVATRDSMVRIYDQRMLGTRASDTYVEESNKALIMKLLPPGLDGKNHRVTSLRYSSRATEILASYSSDHLYLFDIKNLQEKPLSTSLTTGLEENEYSEPTLKRLRLRGDWSDTGPQAMPESERRTQTGDVGQARPALQTTLMQRMTDVLSQMLQQSPATSEERRNTESPSNNSEDGGNPESSNPQDNPENPDPSSNIEQNQQILESPNEASSSQNVNISTNIDNCNELEPTEDHRNINHDDSSDMEKESIDCDDESISSKINDKDESLHSMKSLVSNIGTCSMSQDSASSSRSNDSSAIAAQGLSKTTLQEPANNSVPTSLPNSSSYNVCDNNSISESSVNESNVHIPSHSAESTSDSSGINEGIRGLQEEFDRQIAEPSISLTFSNEGVTCSTISLRVADEVSRSYPNDEQSIEQRNLSPSNEQPTPSTSEQGSSQSTVQNNSTITDPKETTSQPATSISSNSSGPSRSDPTLEEESNDNSADRVPTARCRMAQAINRAVRKSREEEDKHIQDPPDRLIPQGNVLQKYSGHRNARTMIKEACFWGEHHVMSGSDCGRVFVWEKETGKLVMIWEADRHVVNCLQPHPTLPILATSGIDHDIKLWAPTHNEAQFDEDKAAEITRRNEALLEETRDTITVPATFMIRMLASLNDLRQGRARARLQNLSAQNEEGEDDLEDDVDVEE